MRAKTIQRFAILIAVFSLIVGTGFFVQRAQIKRLAQSVDEQADRAIKEGDLLKAEMLLKQHLQNVPDDFDVQFKYANLILEVASTPVRRSEAAGIYGIILDRDPGNKEVRKRYMQLKLDTGRYAGAKRDLLILLGRAPLENPDDGDLQFKMGVCDQETGDEVNAEKCFEAAIKHNASQRLEAFQRRATLLRQRLGQPDKADEVIQAMVDSEPKNYQVYLERGRYRRQFKLPGARDDFQNALRLASDEDKVGVNIEFAKLTEEEHGAGEARKILEGELKVAPNSLKLNDALVTLELRAKNFNRAIEILQDVVKVAPHEVGFRFRLAQLLAQRGDNDGLEPQIEELKRLGFPSVFLRFLRAYQYINKKEYAQARDIFIPIQSDESIGASLRSQVKLLLGRCYSNLGDPEMQREVYLQTMRDNPGDLNAQRGLIEVLIKQGETDRAIEEYEKLVGKVPQVRLPLAQLLIARNRQRPPTNRDWSRVDRLIADEAAETPESPEPMIVQAQSLRAQEKAADAENLLEKARSKFPKSVGIWTAQIALTASQPSRVEEARRLIEKAEQQLGDKVELRLARAKLPANKEGPEVIAALDKLAQNIDQFSAEDQTRLLDGLAAECVNHGELQTAIRLRSQLARRLTNNLELRSNLIELAFMTDDKDLIKTNIEEIKKIEGSDGLMGEYWELRHLISQARRANKKSQDEAKQAKEAASDADRLAHLKASEESQQIARTQRTKARLAINELMSRRGDWARIHLALAELDELELFQVGLDQKQLKERENQEKLGIIIASYLRAIELGQRDSHAVRRAAQLLLYADRGNDALELYSKYSVELPRGAEEIVLERLLARQALKNNDLKRAEEIARRALVADPRDLPERLLLTEILLKTGRQTDGETELRTGVELSKTNPLAWIDLVKFLAGSKQLEKAEKAFAEAQTNLARLDPPMASLTLAQCSEFVGRGYDVANNAVAAKKWYGEAKNWFEKAQKEKPDDPSIGVQFAQFFLNTKQIEEAESHLDSILKSGPGDNPAVAAARRMLASILIRKGVPEQARKALSLFEPIQQAGDASEDQRVLVQVLEAQKTPEYRQQAIEIMKELVDKDPDNFDDRLFLARLYEAAGDWPKARDEYDKLITRTENRENQDVLRRSSFLDQFIRSLINHRKGQETGELAKAQELVDKLKRLQPEELTPVLLEVVINRAQSQYLSEVVLKDATKSQADKDAARKQAEAHLEKASDLLKTFAARPDLTPPKILALAEQTERLGEIELAEKLYTELEAKAPKPLGTIRRAEFLGRRGRVKEALDLVAPLWANAPQPDTLAILCSRMVLQPNSTADGADFRRVVDWQTQALKQHPESTALVATLANVQERIELYKDAESTYRRAIDQGDRSGISHNNLAWLLALNGGNLKDALDFVNRAIELQGPRPDYLDTRGIIYLTKGDYQSAIDDLERSVAGSPSPAKYFHLAEAYFQAKNVPEAKKNWKLANIKEWDKNVLHSLEKTAYEKVLSDLGPP